MDDEALATQAQGGDRAAFAELVQRFEPRLSAYLHRRGLTEADREDVVQETFVRAWRSLAKYDDRWRFSTWMFTIASRVGINLLKSQRRSSENHRRIAHEASARDPGPSDLDRLADRELGGNLWDLAERLLSADQHAAMWLRYAEDLAVRDVARILGRSAISVRVLLHRARHRLAEAIETHDAGESGEQTPQRRTPVRTTRPTVSGGVA